MPSELLSSITGSSGSGNIYPVFEYDNTYPHPSTDNSPLRVRNLCGFEGNGDTINLPIASSSTGYPLEYYDASGNQVTDGVWGGGGMLGSDINSNITSWVGFNLSADGSLLYVVGIDSSPVTLYTATVDKLGVVNLIGSVSASTYPSGSATQWPNTSMNRGPTGGGNLFLHSSLGHISEIDISTGQFVSEYVRQTTITYPYWKTANGNYLGFSGGSMANAGTLCYTQGASGQAVATIPWANGGNSSNSRLLLDWRGRVVFANGSNSTTLNGRAMTYSQINKFGDDLATAMGVD